MEAVQMAEIKVESEIEAEIEVESKGRWTPTPMHRGVLVLKYDTLGAKLLKCC